MILEDLFSFDEESEKETDKPEDKPEKEEKQSKKKSNALPVPTDKSNDNFQKPRIIINQFSEVGIDNSGKAIRSWVQREREVISDEILSTLKRADVEIFNTNGYISCYDKATDNWYLYDDIAKIGVLIDSHIICLRGAHKNKTRVHEPIDAPKNVCEYLIHSREAVSKLDRVDGVARHPYFDNHFKIVNTAGINKDTNYYLPESCVIDDNAYKIDLQEAYDIFEEAFGSMNYREEIDFQSDFAAFLTPPWKVIVGNSPIVSVTSNAPGSGKGLRQRVFNTVWTNNKSAIISKPKSEDSLRQQLFAALRSGISQISVDNISQTLLSDVIATYSTEPYISDRAVYGRTLETYRNNLLISVNGNNLRFSEDITTRILPIHLDINESSLVRDYKAEGRKVEHEIISYAKNNREKIIGASIRIAREYINDNMPDHPTGASRFDTWRRCVLGAVYHVCQILQKDYLLNGFVIKAKADADPESQDRATLWKAILDVIGLDDKNPNQSKPFFCGLDDDHGIFDLASYLDRTGRKVSVGHDILGEYIDGNTERSRMTQLGRYFRDKAINKVHYGWRLEKASGKVRVNRVPRTSYILKLVSKDKFYEPGTEAWVRPQEDSNAQEQQEVDPYEGISL